MKFPGSTFGASWRDPVVSRDDLRFISANLARCTPDFAEVLQICGQAREGLSAPNPPESHRGEECPNRQARFALQEIAAGQPGAPECFALEEPEQGWTICA